MAANLGRLNQRRGRLAGLAQPDEASQNVGIGDVIKLDGWEITVTGTNLFAAAGLLSVDLTIKRTAAVPGEPYMSFDLGLFDPDGAEVPRDDDCPDGFDSYEGAYFLRVASAGTVTVNACYDVGDNAPALSQWTFYVYGEMGEDGSRSYVLVTLDDEQPAERDGDVLATITLSITGRYLADPATCETTGYYASIRPGIVLKLEDADGMMLYQTLLGYFIPDGRSCRWSFDVTGLAFETEYQLRTDRGLLGRFTLEQTPEGAMGLVELGAPR